MANLKQIKVYLRKKKLNYKIIDLGREIYTVKGVSGTGVDENQIVKTLVVRLNKRPPAKRASGPEGFIALAVRGCDRVDFKKVRRLFGNKQSLRSSSARRRTAGLKSELAKPEEVKKIIGVPVGAVCPILIEVPLYFDRKVMNIRHANMGSGDLRHGLEMEMADLLAAVGKYTIEDLVLD